MYESTEESILGQMKAVQSHAVGISLNSFELAFLAGVELWTRASSAIKVSEGDLHQVFTALDESSGLSSESREMRANLAIRKALEQRMMNRISSISDSESHYRLSFLGQAIAGDLIRQDSLSTETLETMLTSIANLLEGIVIQATGRDYDDKWVSQVDLPLRNTVGLLIEVLNQRQRSLDSKQFDTQLRFEELYSQDDSMHGISRCEELLNSVASTLKELDRALMQGTGVLKSKLSLLEELAELANAPKTRDNARDIFQTLDDMIEWTMIRGEKWSEYYQNAHEFLRSSVRLDSHRAFTYRLRHEIGKYHEKPWSLIVPLGDSWRSVRGQEEYHGQEKVMRPTQEITLQDHGDVENPFAKDLADLRESITQKFNSGGTIILSEILEPLRNRDAILFQAAILAIGDLLKQGKEIKQGHRSQWVHINPQIEIQELKVNSKFS
jgi:chromosome partition protein MukF